MNIKDKISHFEEELRTFHNNKYKKAAMILIASLPDYFFKVAASSSGK